MLELRQIDTADHPDAQPAGGVYKARTLSQMHEGEGILDRARHEAARLLEQAQQEAAQLLVRARADAEDQLRQHRDHIDQRLWRAADGLATALRGEWDRTKAELQARLGSLLAGALRRLVHEAPSEQRLHACVRELMSQAGTPDEGVLLVSEADASAIDALPLRLPWPVRCSGDLPHGAVRLVSSQGRWECDIESALDNLLQVFGTALPALLEKEHAS